jgi:hypothetical protein
MRESQEVLGRRGSAERVAPSRNDNEMQVSSSGKAKMRETKSVRRGFANGNNAMVGRKERGVQVLSEEKCQCTKVEEEELSSFQPPSIATGVRSLLRHGCSRRQICRPSRVTVLWRTLLAQPLPCNPSNTIWSGNRPVVHQANTLGSVCLRREGWGWRIIPWRVLLRIRSEWGSVEFLDHSLGV